jgi:dTDP-4-dehydrorhamnose 3,5-epimerase
MAFKFTRLEIPAVVAIQPSVAADRRGYFLECYKESEFVRGGVASRFVQENLSFSVKGVIRGMHYQLNPHAQSKLVGVVSGEVFDVAVDMRTGSPTYGRWASKRLSSENHTLLFVPAGFAHGFCVLSDSALVSYKVTSEYAPASERGVKWDDSALAIEWPVRRSTVSDKDASLPTLERAENNFRYGEDPRGSS